MRVSTLLRTLKLFSDCSDRNRYDITCTGIDTNYEYRFSIVDHKVICDIKTPNSMMEFTLKDVESTKLEDGDFVLRKLEEFQYKNNGMLHEQHFYDLTNEATLFLKLFRIMKEYVNFTVCLNGSYIDCVFLSGKVYYVKETDTSYVLYQTNIFNLGHSTKRCQIVNVSPAARLISKNGFMSRYKRIAEQKGKVFKLNRFGVEVKCFGGDC